VSIRRLVGQRGDGARVWDWVDDNGTVQRREVESLAAGARPQHHNSGDSSERTTSLPIPTVATSEHFRVVYSVPVTLVEGDVLLVAAEMQVTNPHTYNVMCMSFLALTNSETATTGRALNEVNGRNVTPGMHHDQHTKVATFQATSAHAGPRFVNLVAYAASTAALAGHTLKVDADYGRLSVLQW
jgi:hypothetical protein